MGPEKRATCKEVVQKFREVYDKALVDEKYCLQRVSCQPKRVNTDLSTLSPHVFDRSPRGTSNSQSSQQSAKVGHSNVLLVFGTAKERTMADEHEIRSGSRVEEETSRQQTLEVPRNPRGKRQPDSPSTKRSSSRSTNNAGSKISLPEQDQHSRNAKRRGLRKKFRSLLCWGA